MIHFAAAGAQNRDLDEAMQTIFSSISQQTIAGAPDLALVFATSHFESHLAEIGRRVSKVTQPRILLGCNGESVIGPEHEYELVPAISLWLSWLPETDIQPFKLSATDVQSITGADDIERFMGVQHPAESHVILLGDPFTLPVTTLLESVNQYLPDLPITGGMASGGASPGETVLLYQDEVLDEGAVGVSLHGGVRVNTVISQGCRPIGQPYIITQANKNVIEMLGSRPPLEIINEMYEAAPENEQKLMGQGLFVGRVINEYKDKFKRGDFLVRNLLGADQSTGAVAVMDKVRQGTTVQFHLRDAETAEEDLRILLNSYAHQPPKGALLFSCNGRGTRLYPDDDHDLNIIRELLATPPISGFFCAGELGPVGGKNFIHGHTASLVLFEATG